MSMRFRPSAVRKNRKTLLAAPLAALALTGLSSARPANAAETQAKPAVAIEDLSWIAGSWAGEKDGIASEEHWTTPAGGGLVGMHKDVRQGRMVAFEFLRIAVDAAGRVCYLASPGGAPATSFCAVEGGARRVVFENLEHDFPQRILYWLDSEGRLHARIEGPAGEKQKFEEWIWGAL